MALASVADIKELLSIVHDDDDTLLTRAVAAASEYFERQTGRIVSDRIKIMLPPPSANPKLGWRLLDAAGVVEKFGVPPAQIAEYLALVGDSSDNIPGINGVGPKTAAKWLAEWGSLEGVIAHASELMPERFREVVATDAARLRVNLKLTTLNLALPPVKPECRCLPK